MEAGVAPPPSPPPPPIVREYLRHKKLYNIPAVALHSTPPPPVRRTRTASAPVQALVRPKRNASSTTPVATSSAGISQGGLSSPTAPMMNVPASSAMTSSSNCSTVVPLSSASSNSSTSGHRAHDCVPRAVFDALLAENAGLKSQLLEIKKILN